MDAMRFGEAHQEAQLMVRADVLAPERSPVLDESLGDSDKLVTH